MSANAPGHLADRKPQRLFAWVLMATIPLVLWNHHVSFGADSESQQESQSQDRKLLLEEMRQRAEQTRVSTLDGEKRTKTKLVAQPLFRYSDQPRDILDATLWGWGAKGRPVALMKTEKYRVPEGSKWIYCLTSLSENLIEVEWSDRQSFSSKKPGVELQVISDAPKPERTKTKRLQQIKELARRFSATEYILRGQKSLGEMRLLPRPITRYADEKSGLKDGAIFVFSLNGTNPDALLMVELQQKGTAAPAWYFGAARLTNGEVVLRLDGKEVWRAIEKPGPSRNYETWLWFRILKE